MTEARDRIGLSTEQLDHAAVVVRRLVDGLTDDEYLWEPVAGCWSVRPSAEGWVLQVVYPDPDPPPLTTIAWLLVHLSQATTVAAQGVRGRPVTDWPHVSGAAADAVAEWERVVGDLLAAVAGATDRDLDRLYTVPWGRNPTTVARLLWEGAIYETIHHGAEVGRMRHLYANRESLAGPLSPGS